MSRKHASASRAMVAIHFINFCGRWLDHPFSVCWFDVTDTADQSALRTCSYLIDFQFSSIQFTYHTKKMYFPVFRVFSNSWSFPDRETFLFEFPVFLVLWEPWFNCGVPFLVNIYLVHPTLFNTALDLGTLRLYRVVCVCVCVGGGRCRGGRGRIISCFMIYHCPEPHNTSRGISLMLVCLFTTRWHAHLAHY